MPGVNDVGPIVARRPDPRRRRRAVRRPAGVRRRGARASMPARARGAARAHRHRAAAGDPHDRRRAGRAVVRAAAGARHARRRRRRARPRAAPAAGPLRVRRPGPLLPRGPDRARGAAGGRRHARLLLDAAPGRGAAHGRARARRRRRTTSSSSAGGWAAASAARRRRCRCSPASPRCSRAAPAARSSCGSTATTTCARPASATRSLHDYDVGFDDEGRILGARPHARVALRLLGGPVGPDQRPRDVPRRQRYWLPDVAIHSYRCKTNTCRDTAFRGFGGPQGMFAIEAVIDAIARALGRDPLDVRRANLYGTDRAQRHALRHDDRGQRRAGHSSTRSRRRSRLPRAARSAIRAVEPRQPGRQARHRADAGQVRHLVHRDALQPGRRAGARLQRRHACC